MELCLLNLLILIDCFLCNSYPCVLFESLSHVINQESHVYSWNLGKIYFFHFLKFWNLKKLKFQNFKSELGKFIPNFPLKHVITSTKSPELNMRVLVNHTKTNKHFVLKLIFLTAGNYKATPLMVQDQFQLIVWLHK